MLERVHMIFIINTMASYLLIVNKPAKAIYYYTPS